MEQRPFGRSGLRASSLVLGTARWGSRSGSAKNHGPDADTAAALVTMFRAAGGTMIDVAAGSDAETILAPLLTGADDVAIALRLSPTRPSTRLEVLDRLDASLARLDCRHVAVGLVSIDPGRTPLEETLAALDHAVSSGRVGYAGVLEPSAWRLAQAATWQRAWPSRSPIVVDRVEYSLLARGVERDVVPAAAELGAGLLVSAPLAGGALVGRASTGSDEGRGVGAGRAERGDRRALGIVEAVATAADGLATTPVTVALSWLRDRPGISSVVVGARTTVHLTAALQAQELTLPSAIRSALDDVSAPPGPGEQR